MAPVATNSGGSATDSIPLWSQNECTWTDSGTGSANVGHLHVRLQPGPRAGRARSRPSAQPITNGETLGTTQELPDVHRRCGCVASGGLGDAWTINTANPLPTPTDTNPSAAQGDLPSSNLDLTSANSGAAGGCWGATIILASTAPSAFGSGSTADMTLPSSWVNGGDCAYGSLGSNSAGGNTDTPALSGPTDDAACPPSQADVNAGYVNCGDHHLVGQRRERVDQLLGHWTSSSTASLCPRRPRPRLSAGTTTPGDTVSVTGGTNWWGDPTARPTPTPPVTTRTMPRTSTRSAHRGLHRHQPGDGGARGRTRPSPSRPTPTCAPGPSPPPSGRTPAP